MTVEASGVTLPVDEATSLGVALAECLSALLDAGASGPLRIRLGAEAGRTEVAISQATGAGEAGGSLVSVTNGYLLRAVTEQLGAAVALRTDAAGAALVLTMPRAGRPTAHAATGTLH